MQAKVKVRITEFVLSEEDVMEETTSIHDTTVGRAMLYRVLPKGLPFTLVNQPMTKKAISRLINNSYRRVGLKDTVIFADQLMYTGFRQATLSGASIGVNDFVIPEAKAQIVAAAALVAATF